MHVVCNLSVGGVSLCMTLGGAKETTVTDYKSVIAQALTENNAWKVPHTAAILARSAMLGLYSQCLDAVSQAREQGTAIEMKEIPADKADAFEIAYRGRAVGFCRLPSNVIALFFRGFPSVNLFLENPAKDRMMELPPSASMANEWAKRHVTEILTTLVRSA